MSSQSDEQYGSLAVQRIYYTDSINENTQWNNVGVYVETVKGRSIKNRKASKKLLI